MGFIEMLIILLAAFATSFFLIGIPLLIGLRFYIRQKKWIPVNATVIEFTPRADSRKNTLVEYVINGQIFQQKCRFWRGMLNPLFKGQTVQVQHHPSKPHKIAANNPFGLYIAYLCFFTVALVILIVLVNVFRYIQ